MVSCLVIYSNVILQARVKKRILYERTDPVQVNFRSFDLKKDMPV